MLLTLAGPSGLEAKREREREKEWHVEERGSRCGKERTTEGVTTVCVECRGASELARRQAIRPWGMVGGCHQGGTF